MKGQRELVIPPFWEIDWNAIADSYEGEAAKLVLLGRDLALLLKRMMGMPVTPEVAAWLLLWTRQFVIVQSALGAVRTSSWFGLEVLFRAEFELQLQVMTILDPESPGIVPPPAQASECESTRNRLCAYLAFCAWNDKKYHQQMTEKWLLDKVWDDTLAVEAMKDSRIEGLMKALWGDEKLSHPDELRKGKRRHRDEALKARNRAWEWLDHGRCAEWRDLLKSEKHLSFYELIGIPAHSLRARLRGTPLEFGYPAYDYSSMMIHGHTIDAFLAVTDSSVAPHARASQRHTESMASHLRRFSRNTLVGLGLVQRAVTA